jgi:hypothetical protein
MAGMTVREWIQAAISSHYSFRDLKSANATSSKSPYDILSIIWWGRMPDFQSSVYTLSVGTTPHSLLHLASSVCYVPPPSPRQASVTSLSFYVCTSVSTVISTCLGQTNWHRCDQPSVNGFLLVVSKCIILVINLLKSTDFHCVPHADQRPAKQAVPRRDAAPHKKLGYRRTLCDWWSMHGHFLGERVPTADVFSPFFFNYK